MLTQETLQSLLHYDPETGVFTWLMKPCKNIRAGSIAGNVNKVSGYVLIKIDRKLYRAHRLAWLYVHGHFPPEQIDHINRARTDNRICNLRPATNAENHQNTSMHRSNTSGHVGVFWCNRDQKWRAQIKVNYKHIGLGYFTDLTEAIAARKAAEPKYHQFNHPVAA